MNFILFRSVQKLDMFGMDNYYGAPYVIVNNGDHKWDSFNSLLDCRALETDLLSNQWFCLSNEFTFIELEQYRYLIFQNTKEILQDIPLELRNPSASLSIDPRENKVLRKFLLELSDRL